MRGAIEWVPSTLLHNHYIINRARKENDTRFNTRMNTESVYRPVHVKTFKYLCVYIRIQLIVEEKNQRYIINMCQTYIFTSRVCFFLTRIDICLFIFVYFFRKMPLNRGSCRISYWRAHKSVAYRGIAACFSNHIAT